MQTSLLASAAAAMSHSRSLAQDSGMADAVNISLNPEKKGQRIAEDFTGLSYESTQLSDPSFFSGGNTALIGMVRRLGRKGVLRIGGNTSEYCFWAPNATPAELAASSNQEPMGPDPGHKPAANKNITPLAIRNLRDFIDATGWTLIYGLNMGKGSAADAAAEAAFVMQTIGKEKLVVFQLCNEPDLFKTNGIRPATYNAQQFNDEWAHFYDVIRAKVPDASFAGPDTAYGQEWLVPFASRFKKEVKFLSSHYYAEGPPTDPSMTIERLLSNPKLQQQMDGMREVLRETGLPFRLAETNSCYAAGKQGVSDTFASALWAADLMYQLAQNGGMGINFHGGGYGWYTPVAGTSRHGFVARPVFYGLLLFAEAGPGTLIETTVDSPAGKTITAYGLRSDAGKLKVAIFNKSLERGAHLRLSPGQGAQRASVLSLYAPRYDDTVDTTLGAAQVGSSGAWMPTQKEVLLLQNNSFELTMPPASAVLLTLD